MTVVRFWVRGLVAALGLLLVLPAGTAGAASWTWPSAGDRLMFDPSAYCAMLKDGGSIPDYMQGPASVQDQLEAACGADALKQYSDSGITAALLASGKIEVAAPLKVGSAGGVWGAGLAGLGLLVYGGLDYFFGDGGTVTVGQLSGGIKIKAAPGFVPDQDVPVYNAWDASFPVCGTTVVRFALLDAGTGAGPTASTTSVRVVSHWLSADLGCLDAYWLSGPAVSRVCVDNTSAALTGGGGSVYPGFSPTAIGSDGLWVFAAPIPTCSGRGGLKSFTWGGGTIRNDSGGTIAGSSGAGPTVSVVGGASPSRHLVVDYECVAPDGTRRVLTATGADFTQVEVVNSLDGVGNVIPDLPCNPGESFGGADIKEVVGGNNIGTVMTIPDPYADWGAGIVPAVTGDAEPLELSKSDGAGGWESCFATLGLCTGWFADPNKSENYQCTQGSLVLSLSACNAYAPTFEPGQPRYGDPNTGTYTPATVTDPTGTEDDVGGSCWPSGWGAFNPFAWVYMPVKCALVWAFVPTQEQWQSATSGFTEAYQQTSVYAWWIAVSGTFTGLSHSAGACSAWTVDYPVATGGTTPLTVVDPCTGPMATAAGIARTVSGVVIVLFGGLAVVRAILGVGFGIPLRIGGQGDGA
jgi:hypothetical protein